MPGLTNLAAPERCDDVLRVWTPRALRKGRSDETAWFFGHPRTVRATVEHGDARGRALGFPTANMHLDDDDPLAFGIYAVRVKLLNARGVVTATHDGVASFGIRPMFRAPRPLLEAHLFDFSGDLYGRELIVEFVAWLRPEASFEGLDALVAQIHRDAATARAVLRRTP